MPNIQIPYHKSYVTAQIPNTYPYDLIAPRDIPPAPDPLGLIARALAAPLGLSAGLNQFKGVRSAAIAINDKTRPVPHAQLLPPLLARLAVLGIPPDAITFIIANGTHPPMPPDEYPRILPSDLIARYPILSHDAENYAEMIELGQTSNGTPVFINRHYMAADLRIVVGNIEPHQFMGFSGGVKSVAIGLAAKSTINHNHALMTHPDSRLGQYDPNPARADVEEIGRLIRVDFALNALLNNHKHIIGVVAGDPLAVMQAAIPQVRANLQVEVPVPYDLIITSPGGHPKDLNLYQAQKALAHARLIVKEGGTIILVAACPEGTGSQSYENWLLAAGMDSHQAVFARFAREGFRVGAHKAYQISRDAEGLRVFLVSDMPAEFVRRLLLTPADSLQAALDQSLSYLPSGARLGIMPAANATIPSLLS